jgi:hypothetical protein
MSEHETPAKSDSTPQQTSRSEQAPGDAAPSPLLALQRLAGNRAVAGLVAQRLHVQRNGDENPVAKAVRTKDVGDAKEASRHLEGATEQDKFILIDVLRNQGWVGLLDEYALQRIWGSFGEGVIKVVENHLDEWADCVKKGADLDESPVVQHLVTVFELDTKARARSNLRANDAFVRAEFARLGMDPNVRVPDEAFIAPPPEELKRLQETQGLARAGATTISHLLWMKENINYAGERFNPHKKPALDFDLGDGRSLWSMARDEWARGEALLGMIANSSPAVFAAMDAATPAFERESCPVRCPCLPKPTRRRTRRRPSKVSRPC